MTGTFAGLDEGATVSTDFGGTGRPARITYAGGDGNDELRGHKGYDFLDEAEATDLALTQVEREYLEASLAERRAREAAEAQRLAHEADLERRSRNFLRALVGVFALAAVIAVALSIFAFQQRQTALCRPHPQRAVVVGQEGPDLVVRQGRGIGRATMEEALDRFTHDGATNVALSYSPENEVARHLYRSMGFVETGEMEDDEIVARYRRS